METILLDNIPFDKSEHSVIEKFKIEPDTEDAVKIHEMFEEARGIATPKAVFASALLKGSTDDTVIIEGLNFRSKILAYNLRHLKRVFPYAATCGTELDIWASKIVDPLEKYWAGEIQELALASAVEMLYRHITTQYGPEKISSMNPGSLEDWPIDQQKPLFELLGDVTDNTGIRLTGSMLMIPVKSVSGIYFATDMDYENCRLCQKEKCSGRKAAFDPMLYKSD